MKLKVALIAIATLSLACSAALAQPRPAKAPSPPGYEFHLKIDDGGKVFASMVSDESTGAIAPGDLTQLVLDLPTGTDRFNKASGAFPRVVIEPSAKIMMLDLWNPITMFPRGRTAISLSVPVGDGVLHLSVPWDDPNRAQNIKPNPLILIVKVGENGSLTLNNEPEGTISDPHVLVYELRNIFSDRAKNGVFREGTNDVESSVTILMPMSGRKVSDLATVAGAIRDSGSDRISLSMDEGRNFVIDTVPTTPPKKPHEK